MKQFINEIMNQNPPTKTSKIGTKEGETRATFIVNEELLEIFKALAYLDRKNIKDVFHRAMSEYTKQQGEDKIKEALQLYRTEKGKE